MSIFVIRQSIFMFRHGPCGANGGPLQQTKHTNTSAVKTILRLEELAQFVLSIVVFAQLPFAWWWYPALILLPDISMIGYTLNPQIGAFTYNLGHHKGLALAVGLAGVLLHVPVLMLAGVILFGHSSMDRMMGYGLKYSDSFKHTHLGAIGNP